MHFGICIPDLIAFADPFGKAARTQQKQANADQIHAGVLCCWLSNPEKCTKSLLRAMAQF